MLEEEPTSGTDENAADLCECSHKRRVWVRAEIERLGLHTVEEVYARLLGGGGCRTCAVEIERLLRDVWDAPGGGSSHETT